MGGNLHPVLHPFHDGIDYLPRKKVRHSPGGQPLVIYLFPDGAFRKLLKDEIRRMIEKEITDKFSDKQGFEIDETAVSRYEKSGQNRKITCETAASYDDGEMKKYTCIQTLLSYINSKSLDGEQAGPQALICPSCGAPLTRFDNGDVRCEFCSTVVVGEKIWQITEIKEKP